MDGWSSLDLGILRFFVLLMRTTRASDRREWCFGNAIWFGYQVGNVMVLMVLDSMWVSGTINNSKPRQLHTAKCNNRAWFTRLVSLQLNCNHILLSATHTHHKHCLESHRNLPTDDHYMQNLHLSIQTSFIYILRSVF